MPEEPDEYAVNPLNRSTNVTFKDHLLELKPEKALTIGILWFLTLAVSISFFLLYFKWKNLDKYMRLEFYTYVTMLTISTIVWGQTLAERFD